MTIQSRFLADTDLPLCRLEVKHHFDALTSKEKAYGMNTVSCFDGNASENPVIFC
jgi:hypothetical protein